MYACMYVCDTFGASFTHPAPMYAPLVCMHAVRVLCRDLRRSHKIRVPIHAGGTDDTVAGRLDAKHHPNAPDEGIFFGGRAP